MLVNIKKFLFFTIFNSSLFLMLIIGIQNSSYKNKITFLKKETIELPTSFIMGISFIAGSVLGSFIDLNGNIKKI